MRTDEKMNDQTQDFEKVLSRFDILVLAFGAMIGWGWVVLSGEWILSAGSFGALIAFAIGGLLVIFIGLTFAELASAIPKDGGELHFALRAMGRSASFITSWAIILGYISVACFEAVALPTVIEYLFPDLKFGYMWTVNGWDVYFSWVAIGIVGALVMTALNYFGIKTAAKVQLILTLIIAVIGLLLIFGSQLGNGDTANLQPLFHNKTAGIMSVLIMTPFMFVGFGVIPQAAGEANVPPRAIGLIMIVSVLCAIIFYLAIIYSVSLALDTPSLQATKLATADAMGTAYGSPLFAKLLILGGVAGILTSWNGFIIGGSRLLYAMSEEKLMPPWFGKLHPRYKTPTIAIVLIGILSIASPLLGRPMLTWLVDAGGLSINIAWFMVALSFLVLRKREPEMERPYRAGKSAVIGWIGIILAFAIGMLYMPGMSASLTWPSEWLIFISWWVIGLLFFIQMMRRKQTRDEAFKIT
jgi:amino acid transporter